MAKITRFGVLKMALFTGIYGAFIGLIFAILMGIFISIFGFIIPSGNEILPIFNFSWFFLLLFPIIYGVVGFIAGLILTPIINLILKIINGIDLNIETSDTPAYPTQPVQQYPMPPRRQY